MLFQQDLRGFAFDRMPYRKEKWYETVWFALFLILVVVIGFWALFISHK